MDKLKDFWRVLRRIHFWLICSIVLLLSTIMWFVAVKQIAKEKDANITKYKGDVSSVKTVAGTERIPNQLVAAKMEELIEDRTTEIGDAWRVKFDEQNSDETAILTWPVEEMGEVFVRHMEPLRPIEKELPFPVPEGDLKLTISLRENYREYIQNELPRLAESIGARWQTGPSAAGSVGGYGGGAEGGYGGGGYGGGGRVGAAGAADPTAGESLSKQAVVHWDPKNQAEIRATHFTWGGDQATGRGGGRGYGAATTGADDIPPPDVLEILYAQEDLWVLRAVMKIIKETNGDASTRFNAAVKTIHSIRIGKDAVAMPGLGILKVQSSEPAVPAEGAEAAAVDDGYGSGGYGGGGGGGVAESSTHHTPNVEPAGEGAAGAAGAEGGARTGYGDDGGGYGGYGGGAMAVATDPAEGRYVDSSYKPLSAEKLRSVLAMAQGETMEPEDAYLAVAKRIPVRLRLSIDQRKLTNLLIACGNSKLTVEVRQLRWNPEDSGELAGAAGGSGGYGGGGYGRGEGDGGYGGSSPGALGGATTSSDDLTTPFPYDVIVEIYGIIYLYNPVDERALGVEPEKGDVSRYETQRTPGFALAKPAKQYMVGRKSKSLNESWESKLTRTSTLGTGRRWS